MGNAIDNLQFHELVGQKSQGPSRATFGSLTASQMNKVGFRGAMELFFPHDRIVAGFNSLNQPLENTGLANPFDGSDAHPQIINDLLVTETAIGRQKNASALDFRGCNLRGTNHLFERCSLVFRQRDEVFLHGHQHRECAQSGPSFYPSKEC